MVGVPGSWWRKKFCFISAEMLQLYFWYLGLKLFLPDCVIARECGILGNIWIRLELRVLADVCQSDA